MNYQLKLAKVISGLIEQPQNKIYGFIKEANKNIDADWSVNCFVFKTIFNKNGPEIAVELSKKITSEILKENKFIENVKIAGPYLNFKISKKIMTKDIFYEIMSGINEYSVSFFKKTTSTKRIVIEYPAPNTNKPLHLGHIRNMLLGQTISVLNEYIGNKVYQVNLLNDRGVHICKSMWAYKKWGNGKTPQSEKIKSDHFVGEYYVLYSEEEVKLKKEVENLIKELESEKIIPKKDRDNKKIKNLKNNINSSEYGKLQKEITQMLVDWENKDTQVRTLWRKMNDWAEEGYKETFKIFKIHHDKVYFESEIYDKGKEIVLDGLKKGTFERLNDGAIVIKFNKKGLPKQKVLLRKNGTTLYITQDIYLAYKKMEDFNYDLSVYIVGNEQDMQLKCVFETLKKLGMKAKNLHYSYGMINLPAGKMKSREGTVVDADNVVFELKELAFKEILKRYKNLDEKETEKRAEYISMAALRFFILKYDYSKDFIFDPEKSLSFEGETGPYILYAYARICSIFKKGIESEIAVPFNLLDNKSDDLLNPKDIDYSLFKNEHEICIIDLIYKYPSTIYETTINMKPHVLARYLLLLAQEFNSFYHSCPILKERKDIRKARLILCEMVRKVLKNGLNLLTINVLNEM
ncbi:MAG: arginine--tRNA ligase [Promethearchaeota archaeon]